MPFNLSTRRWEEAAENTLLSDFQQWFQAHRSALQASGLMLVFQPEREQQTVKAGNLSAVRGPYEAHITLWETGDFDAEIGDMSDDASLNDDARFQFVHHELMNSEELEAALADVLERLRAMPKSL